MAWGDLAVDRLVVYSGNWPFTNRTQPGQQEVNMGHLYWSRWVNRCKNSVPSSMMVRSAVKLVSKT